MVQNHEIWGCDWCCISVAQNCARWCVLVPVVSYGADRRVVMIGCAKWCAVAWIVVHLYGMVRSVGLFNGAL